MQLSNSKLNLALSCPYQYYLKYIYGFAKNESSPALYVGSAVHYGIENNTYDLTEVFKTFGSFKQQIGVSYEQHLSEAMVYGYLKHKDQIFKEILHDEETNTHVSLIEEIHELELYAKLPSKNKPNTFYDFIGIIDLLLLTDKGWILIDYKTSSKVPNWDDYLEQIYKYIYLLQTNYPDIPVYKIGIINLRKSMIRQKRTENDTQFLHRLKLEYELNEENYINYHCFEPEKLDVDKYNKYISNLSELADYVYSLEKNRNYFINYGNSSSIYGKSEFFDIIYNTPGAEELYSVRDSVYDEVENKIVKWRKATKFDITIATKKIENDDNVINKYEKFLKVVENFQNKKNIKELFKDKIIDEELLNLYITTFNFENKEV